MPRRAPAGGQRDNTPTERALATADYAASAAIVVVARRVDTSVRAVGVRGVIARCRAHMTRVAYADAIGRLWTLAVHAAGSRRDALCSALRVAAVASDDANVRRRIARGH